jgi:ribosomal protein L11 methylase PrmA
MLLKSDDLTAKSVAEIKVLELGSGTGVLGIGIASLGCNVVLTDPALDMNLTEDVSSNTLEHLRKNLEQNKSITGDRFGLDNLMINIDLNIINTTIMVLSISEQSSRSYFGETWSTSIISGMNIRILI